MCWIARDKDKMLCVYNTKPHKYKESFGLDDYHDNWFEIDENEFPEITWENSPVEITSLKQVKQ